MVSILPDDEDDDQPAYFVTAPGRQHFTVRPASATATSREPIRTCYTAFPGFPKKSHFWKKLGRNVAIYPTEIASAKENLRARKDAERSAKPIPALQGLLSLPLEMLIKIVGCLDDQGLLKFGATCEVGFLLVIRAIEDRSYTKEAYWAGLALTCSHESDTTPPLGFTWSNKPNVLYAPYDGEGESDRMHRNYWSRMVDTAFGLPHRVENEERPARQREIIAIYKNCFSGSKSCSDSRQIWLLRNLDRNTFITCCHCQQYFAHVKPERCFWDHHDLSRDEIISVDDVIYMQIVQPLLRFREKYAGEWVNARLDIVSLEEHRQLQGMVPGSGNSWADVTDEVLIRALSRRSEAIALLKQT